MTRDMDSSKKINLVVTETFLRGRKLLVNMLVVFTSQSYFKVPKTITLNATRYFTMKITNKKEFEQPASNHSFNIEFKIFMKLYKNYTKESYSFLVNNTTLSPDNPLQFR